jgi:hypothetical protein
MAACLAALPVAGALGVQALREREVVLSQNLAPVSPGSQGAMDSVTQLDATLRKSGIKVEGPLTDTPLMATQIMFVSSPSSQKVVYTELRDFKSTSGITYPLVDSGLAEPCGLAVDRRRGDLYVADRGQKMIFRYTLLAHQAQDGSYQLQTDGTRVTIVENRSVEWIALDQNGTLFFTDSSKNSVNKVTKEVLDRLLIGDYTAEDLQVVPESEQAAGSQLLQLHGGQRTNATSRAVELYTAKPRILSMYEGSANPQVSSPSGVVADGPRLFWANGANGTKAGTLVQGQATPWAPPSLAAKGLAGDFPTAKVADSADRAYGIAKTNTLLFFTGKSSSTGRDAVFGVDQYGGPVFNLAPGLSKPRGLAWDGDNTVYVADEGKNFVWSMPAGRLVASAPVSKAVEFSGAYGVALISKGDPGFTLMTGASALTAVLAPTLQLMLIALAAAGLGAA